MAESLRHDPDLHRVAMRAVFLIEDCLFALTELKEHPQF